MSGEEKADSVACKFPLDSLGTECTYDKKYGYDEGRPCVILKFNRVSITGEPEKYDLPLDLSINWSGLV